ATRPVAAAQAGDGHARLLVRRVHELAVANVDAVVAQPSRVRVLEKHQVTRLEFVPPRVRPAVVFALQPATDRPARLAYRVPHQPRTVEATRRRSAPHIWRPEQ